jgi:steroid 5-alpha reductase family enzyme
MNDKIKGRIILLCVYLFAFGIGIWSGNLFEYHILLKSAVTMTVTVLMLFLGSLIFNNSSVFDPYWSVAPPFMVIYYFVLVIGEQSVAGHAGFSEFLWDSPRMMILFFLTFAYSARLTWNFLRTWPGMKHEDWRYVDFRTNTGKAYWIVSLTGIHLFPALMVFGGTLSIWVAVVQGTRQLNVIDFVAILVTGCAILLEATADRQLRAFLTRNRESARTMNEGLWSLSRHPNYLGEILFWWGLFLFSLAANTSFWWVIAGPLAITLMFIFASIPMIEKRMIKRKKDYRAYQDKVSMLVPWRFFG